MRMQKGEWTQVYDLVPNKAISVKHYDELITELALLRKVADAARDVVGFGVCHDENSLWSIKALQNTIENYEGWKKEGQR